MGSYTLGGIWFYTKEGVRLHAKAIKDRHKPGDVLEGEERAFMSDLLLWHPDAAGKIGVGIRQLMVRANPKFGQNEFYLIRTDGSATEFSYKQCVQPSTPEADFTTACRVAVAPDIVAFQQAYFKAHRVSQCVLTGEELTLHNAHVDHIPPRTFKAILKAFVELRCLKPAEVALRGRHIDNHIGAELADEALKADWVLFHRANAELRVISEQANLGIVGKGWDGILEHLDRVKHADTLVEWKGQQRFYTHLPGVTRGVLMSAERAPEGTPLIDGTPAVIEASVNALILKLSDYLDGRAAS